MKLNELLNKLTGVESWLKESIEKEEYPSHHIIQVILHLNFNIRLKQLI